MEKARADDIVLAVGNPFGLPGSVTEGIISATGRAVTEPATRARPGRGAERCRIVAVTSGEPADKGRAAGRGR